MPGSVGKFRPGQGARDSLPPTPCRWRQFRHCQLARTSRSLCRNLRRTCSGLNVSVLRPSREVLQLETALAVINRDSQQHTLRPRATRGANDASPLLPAYLGAKLGSDSPRRPMP